MVGRWEVVGRILSPFGAITSAGVDGGYSRCLVERYTERVYRLASNAALSGLFPPVLDFLARWQDAFGEVGKETSLVDKIVGSGEAKVSYLRPVR